MKRFSLLSLMLLVTMVAVAITAWNQFRQTTKIQALEAQLELTEKENRIRARLLQLYQHLDLLHPADIKVYELLQRFTKSPEGSWRKGQVPALNPGYGEKFKLADVNGIPGGLEILSISSGSDFIYVPGMSFSVNVLFEDGEVIDVLVRRTSTRIEWHEVELEDQDKNGMVDLVLNCSVRSGGVGSLDREPKTLVYEVTENGFKLVGE